ncbi:hypothetical protein N7468_010339 [Penicillium chermesinum]|uniref:Uncharacterized protein n=1 Tax=Penicillium chermesinum TaxID=63820 RepID=A0A9W9NCI1_9EURO|nr:uncharacterized protein N7468_010339 [Penicillium chermesinum]KAJ5217331.1 hypothetical protein N7468_010339 [Penicillium chermesinum]KAJ6171057.1 hypothetical protein N7470_000124 [Penicillium chermesinum]
MRSSTVFSVLSTPFLLLNLAGNAIASPLIAAERSQCSNPCGWGNEYCCAANEACTTSDGKALCVAGGGSGGGGWEYFTTTWTATETETTTIVSVWSSSAPAITPAPTGSGTCQVTLGWTVCGSSCCDKTQECIDGQCVDESSSAAVTGEPTPGIRPTSSGASTVTQTSAPTTTEGFIAPVGTDGADLIGAKATSSGGGLSGGAIAGIVIGTIAGVILLLLLCACLCFKEALDGILAALGIGKRRRKETTTYEHYSHHSSGTRPRPQGRTWFGARQSDSEVSEKKSSGKGWAYVAIVLGALALCLGLRRRREEHDDGSTSYTYPSSYYYYSEYSKSKVPGP